MKEGRKVENITDLIEKFKSFVNTDDGKEWKKDREERRQFYSKLFGKDHIKILTEEEFKNAIKSLWASNFWTNKDWLVNKIITQNGGIDRIKDSLSDLLYGEDPLHKRYDNCRISIKGIGPSMLTELMAFVEPQKYCIWNDKPKTVLPYFEMDKLLPDRVFKYQISGKDYESCIRVMSTIKNELKVILPNPDFIDADHFLWFIFSNILPTTKLTELTSATKPVGSEEIFLPKEDTSQISPEIEIQNHATAQRALIELGNLLGFDTYLPPEDRGRIVNGIKLEEIAALKEIPQFTHQRLLDTVKHIDVIWFRDEWPIFCFEVEESTDVTKGLLRLYQIRQLNMTPIIVGQENKRSKFQAEIEKDPFYNIKTRYKFIPYEELAKILEISKRFFELKKKLLGEMV